MADRTVNVNIKYNVDTAQVQRAQAASIAAQKATDQLRKATDDYGKASVQANKAAQDSLRKTSSDVNSLAKDFNGLYASVKAVLTAGLLKEFVDLSLSMARLSGQVEGVTVAFNRLPNATLLLNDLRKATRGTVTDLALMQKALSASNFRIPLEKLGTLLEFAAVKAQQTGQEVNHLVDYIVSGIGYRSIKRLDDLGFTANRVREALGGVSLQAASMGQVMDAITKLMNEDLAKTGGLAETSATKVGQLETKWKKLNETISAGLTSPKLLEFYDSIVTNLTAGVNFLIGGQQKIREEIAKTKAIEEVAGFQQMHLTKEILKDKQKTLDIVQQEANTRTQLIGRNNDEIKQLKERFKEITDSGRFMTRQEDEEVGRIKEQLKFYTFKNIVLKESIRILNEYNKSLDKVTEKESPEGDEGKLVTDPVALTLKKFNKKTYEEKSLDRARAGLLDISKLLQEAADKIPPINIAVTPYIPPYQDSELEKAFEKNREEIINSSLFTTENIINSTLQREVDSYSMRIEALRSFYDEQIELAGDNERAKKEIRIKEDREIKELEKQRADREKRAAQAGIIVNTALAVIKIFAGEGTYIDKLIRAGIMAAEGAAQYAIATRARYYAKGEINIKGPGTETSDSIPAMLSKGESIMTAKQTKDAFGILTDIRAGRLNDKVLKQLAGNGGQTVQSFNDQNIVHELKGIRKNQPDFIRKGRQLYEVYADQQGNKRYIRSKSI